MAHIESRGFNQQVVGEQHYTRALKKCYNSSNSERIDERSVSIPVLLHLENNNRYDKNAVAVMSEFGIIGHLSRDDAIAYRELYGEDEEHTTIAKIYTRTGEIFSAYLSLTITEHTSQRVLERNTPNHDSFTPKPKKPKASKDPNKKGFFARLFGR